MSDENWNELFGENLDDLPIAQTQVTKPPQEGKETRLRKGVLDDESDVSTGGQPRGDAE
ncbi:hypothetical protein Pmar_PMAR026451, partial [Perkinsus marinus ATCC 50983]